jgi:serine/threonine protein kinase
MFEEIDSTGHMLEGRREANIGNESLQDRLQNMSGQPFSLEETFAILTQLGQALAYAHKCDVTHGNLKPDNILFDDKGDVLLADFFLRALAAQPDEATGPEASAYRAPELLPSCASKQGDQYALACIAYEMLTGQKPFLIPSVNQPGSFYRTKTLVPPRNFNLALSSLGEEAILKALEKEPAQRHSDISSFLTALGISIDTKDQAALMATVPLPSASGLSKQAPPLQVPVEHLTEEAERPNVPTQTLTLDPAQTSRPAKVEEFPPNASGTLLGPMPLIQMSQPSAASMRTSESHRLVNSIVHSPSHGSFGGHLLTDATATNPNAPLYASVYARPLSTGSMRHFFKWKPIGAVIACLVIVCIFATSFFILSTSFSKSGGKPMPVKDITIDLSSPTPASTTPSPSTPMPEATTTPEQEPTVTPVISPATVQPTPTPKQHGRPH